MSRTKFIVAVAVSLAVLPITAGAESSPPPSAAPSAAPVAMEGAREMTKAMMMKAFKNFSATLDSEEKTVHLAGVTSEECMKHFEVSNEPNDTSFRVEFTGGPAHCLSHSKLKCDDKNPCSKLSEVKGAKMDLAAMSDEAKKEADEQKIVLLSKKLSKKDPFADIPQGVEAEENTPEQLSGYDVQEKKIQKLAYTSEEVLEELEKARLKKLAKAKMDRCIKFAAQCKGYPEALKAIEYIEENAEDSDDSSIDDDYIADLKHAQSKGELALLLKELNGIRATDSARIGEIKDEMLKLAGDDKKLIPDVTAVLKKIAMKELTDPTSLTADARKRQLETLESMKDLLSKDEYAALEAATNKTYFQRSMSEGAGSPNYQDALALQKAPFNAKLIEAGCMSEAGQKVGTPQCRQLEQTILMTPEFRGLASMDKIANDIQTDINTRRDCEQGILQASTCVAYFEQQRKQQQSVLDPAAANANMIPNPFVGAPQNQVAGQQVQQNGVIPNTGLVNQQPSLNPFLTSALPANPFETSPNQPLSVFMNNSTAQNTTLQKPTVFPAQQPLPQQVLPNAANTGFAHRS